MKKTLLLLIMTPMLYAQSGWQLISNPFTESFNCTYIESSGVLFVGTDLGNIYYSNTVGNSWDTAATGVQDGISEIIFISNNEGWAVGDDGLILTSTDGGATWATISSGVTSNLESIFFADTSTAYIAGRDGTILKSTNGGTSWTSQTSGTTDRLESVCFTSTTRGFVAGRDGVFLETSNGGNTWTSINLGSDDNKDIHFVDANTGFVAGENGIFKTINGGTTWTATTVNGINEVNAMHFANPSVGYVVGESGDIGTSIDAGNNWAIDTILASLSNVELNDVYFLNSQVGFAVGDNATLLMYLGSTVTNFCQASYWVDTVQSGGGNVYVVNNSAPSPSNTAYTSSYIWDFGDGNISTQRLPVHTYANSGAYNLCVTILSTDAGNNLCTQTFCDTVGLDSLGNLIHKNGQAGFTLNVIDSNSIGIVDYKLDANAIFPNPASDKLYLNLPLEWNGNQMQILNNQGGAVKQEYFDPSNPIELQGVNAGFYIFRIVDDEGNWHYSRLLVQ